MRLMLISIVFNWAQMGLAQKNAVYIETFGNAGLISLNYERQFFTEPKLSLRIGLGFSFFEIEEERQPSGPSGPDVDYGINLPDIDLSIPIAVHYLFNVRNGNYVETGLGYTFQFGSNSSLGRDYDEKAAHLFLASVGFRRYFWKRKSWFWKANFTPILAIMDSGRTEYGFQPWMGVSVGKRF